MAKQQNSGGAARTVETLVRPTVEGMGLRLWDVRFEKEGPDWFLRVLIDRMSRWIPIPAKPFPVRSTPSWTRRIPLTRAIIWKWAAPGWGGG